MEKLLALIIFRRKSRFMGLLLGCTASAFLFLIGTPQSIIQDISKLYFKLDFLRALQASMWLINRSPLKINSLGINYKIGEILSENSKLNLYNSPFIQNSSTKDIDKSWLILSALTEQENNTFWNKEYHKHFKNFQAEMKKYSKKKPIANKKSKHINPNNALQALDDLDEFFKTLNLPFFLVSGTFLGLVREKKFLGHDYDIDVGCLEDKFNLKNFLTTLESNNNFYLKELCYYLNESETNSSLKVSKIPYTIKLLHKSYISIDIFIHFQVKNSYIHGTGIHLWDNEKFELAEYEFYGKKYLGAKNFNQYLTENYGNWKIPNISFDCDVDTPNLIFPPTPQAYLYLKQHYENSEV